MLWLPCGVIWMCTLAAIAAVIYSFDPKHNWWAWLLMIPGTGALMFLIFYVFNCDKEKMRVPRDKFLDCFASAGECALSRVLSTTDSTQKQTQKDCFASACEPLAS